MIFSGEYVGIIKKLKQQAGSKEHRGGLVTFLIQRQRMYVSMFGMLFLVSERLVALFGLDFGITEIVKNFPAWVWCVIVPIFMSFWAMWSYVDLKFIVPGERATSTGRDPYIQDIHRIVCYHQDYPFTLKGNAKVHSK